MNSKILYVTSFNQNLYNISGCNLINSFLDNNLDDEILICYETINNKNYLSYLEKYKNIHLYNLSNNDFLNNWLKDNKNIIPKKYNGTYTGNYKDDLLKKINNEFNYLKCNRIKKLQQNLNDKNKMALNDAGCHLHLVPNPYNKKERSDMIIIRDLLDVDYKSIVGLITSDGDFKPYLNQLQSKVKDLFVITNNEKNSTNINISTVDCFIFI